MKRTRLFADAIALPSLLLPAAAEVLTYAIDPGTLVENLIAGLTFVVGFGSAGWLLESRVPTNPIGWCFAFAAFTSVAQGWAHLGLKHRAEPAVPGVARHRAVACGGNGHLGFPGSFV